MNNVTVKEMCLLTKLGIEIWMPEEKATKLQKVMNSGDLPEFIQIEGRSIGKFEIAGIFYPIDLEEYNNRKQGKYKCKYGKWHKKNEECECYYETDEYKKEQNPNYKEDKMTKEQIDKGREKLRSMVKDKLNFKK